MICSFLRMKKRIVTHACLLLTCLSATVLADEPTTAEARYGLLNGLDHRSFYQQGDFPEPFLVDDTGLELNEARLDWLRSGIGSTHQNNMRAEVEKGFGVATAELEVPYEYDSAPQGVTQGFANIDLGIRSAFYQFVSPEGRFDSTTGAAIEVGIPTGSPVGQNAELVPKLFDDVRLGQNFTVQSLVGYSMLFGPGEEGGLHALEYGLVLGYAIPHATLPLPGIQQFIPMFELSGETGLNDSEAGDTSILGNACFRLNLNPIGQVQPRLGLGYVFPMDRGARQELHWGIFTSLVFEY